MTARVLLATETRTIALDGPSRFSDKVPKCLDQSKKSVRVVAPPIWHIWNRTVGSKCGLPQELLDDIRAFLELPLSTHTERIARKLMGLPPPVPSTLVNLRSEIQNARIIMESLNFYGNMLFTPRRLDKHTSALVYAQAIKEQQYDNGVRQAIWLLRSMDRDTSFQQTGRSNFMDTERMSRAIAEAECLARAYLLAQTDVQIVLCTPQRPENLHPRIHWVSNIEATALKPLDGQRIRLIADCRNHVWMAEGQFTCASPIVFDDLPDLD